MPSNNPSKRRRFTSEQKAAIVRRHMVDKIPISDLCDEYGLQPSVLHGWVKQVTDNLACVFENLQGGDQLGSSRGRACAQGPADRRPRGPAGQEGLGDRGHL